MLPEILNVMSPYFEVENRKRISISKQKGVQKIPLYLFIGIYYFVDFHLNIHKYKDKKYYYLLQCFISKESMSYLSKVRMRIWWLTNG